MAYPSTNDEDLDEEDSYSDLFDDKDSDSFCIQDFMDSLLYRELFLEGDGIAGSPRLDKVDGTQTRTEYCHTQSHLSSSASCSLMAICSNQITVYQLA
uniref:Uncharacterized protein n=1 Tax=Amphimedon queenslandica TaxID=400682 RepID=A0A1X7T612_AMPQE